MRSTVSIGVKSAWFIAAIPALLMRTSRPPKSRRIWASASFTSASPVTSAQTWR
jgi:hypothetical protein